MDYKKIYEEWLSNPYFDEATKEELRSIKDDDKEIKERFYKDLEFGTAGLRGVIGAGIKSMNIYVVRRATQGLANYIIKQGGQDKGVAIAYDSRRMSPEFAEEAALTLAANGIKAYKFESLRPTPELSYAVRTLKCIAGINITASHNPKDYNGYNPVRRVEIPKETKGEFRKLGVPTVVDRVIQQAIAQELSPVYEERFSENSFGFRPKRGAHDALRQCQKNVNDGYVYVVDMDLEKFFDTVCQSKLIEVLSRTIKDKNYAQWYCSGKIGRGELACSDPATVSGVRLNKYLVEMADMLLDYSTIEYSKNLLKRRTLKWLEDLKDQLSTPTNNEAVEKAIADLERKRGNLIDLYTDGLITKTEFKSKSVELDNELEKQKALLDAQEVNPDIKAIEDTIT